MNCRPIPGGFACGSRARRVKCSVPSCANWSTLECDYPIPSRKSGTCDAKLCERCTTKDGEADLCPPHRAMREKGDTGGPACVECGKAAALVTGEALYPHRWDLHAAPFWLCPCGAFTGCHRGSKRPRGLPGNAETRTARCNAHLVFDELWKRKAKRDGCTLAVARKAGYAWLTAQMGRSEQVHIGEMSAAEARRVVEICRRVGR